MQCAAYWKGVPSYRDAARGKGFQPAHSLYRPWRRLWFCELKADHFTWNKYSNMQSVRWNVQSCVCVFLCYRLCVCVSWFVKSSIKVVSKPRAARIGSTSFLLLLLLASFVWARIRWTSCVLHQNCPPAACDGVCDVRTVVTSYPCTYSPPRRRDGAIDVNMLALSVGHCLWIIAVPVRAAAGLC